MGNKVKKTRALLCLSAQRHIPDYSVKGGVKQAHRFALLRQEIKCQGSGNLLGKNMEEEGSHTEKYNSKLKIVNFLKAQKSPLGFP